MVERSSLIFVIFSVLILTMSFRDIVVNSSADNKPSLQEDMDANLKTDRSVFDEEDPDVSLETP